ncbi:MAG: hypothetical protein F4Z31_10420 [Gemmatimonadetes bacterium]|nr:hypothetical protein [Gemmatimonadota bacterium]MYJ12516.1 hypothetical protein [Gemmatimonadota bacterium]
MQTTRRGRAAGLVVAALVFVASWTPPASGQVQPQAVAALHVIYTQRPQCGAVSYQPAVDAELIRARIANVQGRQIPLLIVRLDCLRDWDLNVMVFALSIRWGWNTPRNLTTPVFLAAAPADRIDERGERVRAMIRKPLAEALARHLEIEAKRNR